jgi:hypothetical protein
MSPDELLLRRLAREIEAELANIEWLRSEMRDAPIRGHLEGFRRGESVPPGKRGYNFARHLLFWKHCGLNIDNSVRMLDRSPQKSLAGYIARPPFRASARRWLFLSFDEGLGNDDWCGQLCCPVGNHMRKPLREREGVRYPVGRAVSHRWHRSGPGGQFEAGYPQTGLSGSTRGCIKATAPG